MPQLYAGTRDQRATPHTWLGCLKVGKWWPIGKKKKIKCAAGQASQNVSNLVRLEMAKARKWAVLKKNDAMMLTFEKPKTHSLRNMNLQVLWQALYI